MSFARLNVFISEIKTISEMETGQKEEKPLEGENAWLAAKKLFGKGKK